MARRHNAKKKAIKNNQKHTKTIQNTKKRDNDRKCEQAKKYIRNLSDRELSNDEILVLAKGLKFIPDQQNRLTNIMKDFTDFERRMRLQYHFNNEPNTAHPFKTKSDYNPPFGPIPLENYLYATKYELSCSQPAAKKANLTEPQMQAINDLQNDKSIVIKKADKNNTTVLLNKDEYIDEAYRQLYDGIHYIEIDKLDLSEIQTKVDKLVLEMEKSGSIDDITFKFLNEPGDTIRKPRIYFLPKIHKQAEKINKMDPVKRDKSVDLKIPGRPIISACGSPTENLGKFLDHFLLPIVKQHDTYIKDTTDFIKIIENTKIHKNVIIAVYDVTSLYTNLPFKDILTSLEEALNTNSNMVYDIPRPQTRELIEITRLILENNVFEFNNKFFKQTVGAPQGAVPSPEICDIAIYAHINKILSKFPHKDKILLHKRFRDDGFILYNGDSAELENLFQIANKSHDLLKFTHEISNESVSFLDLTIYKGENFYANQILDIKSYTKPTETFQYLDRTSAHQPSCFKSLITGELTRHVRNNSSEKNYTNISTNFRTRLLKRGYDKNEIDECLHKVQYKNRKTLLYGNKNKETDQRNLVFVTKYNHEWPNLKATLHKHWNIIRSNPNLQKMFKDKPMIAYRRNRNLGEMLTSTLLH